MTEPLAGITVVEFGHYIAAPAATQLLLDLGAEVIKVEPPQGDQARSIGAYGEGIVLAFNRGKKSVVLDLREERDRRIARDLVGRADVLVQNLRPGTMERFGLGPEELTAAHPQLIYVSVSGFGRGTPSAARPGLDIVAQAESGLMSINGEQGGDPLRVGFPIADAAASYAVVQAVLAALFRRERTGEGGVVDVSLLQAMVHMQAAMWGEWHAAGKQPLRKGNGQATVAPAADVFHTADGAIVLSAYTPEHFGRLCRFLGKEWMVSDERFADNPSRVAHRPALLAEIADVIGTYRTDECLAALADNGIVAAAVRTYEEVAEAGDVAAGGILTTGVSPDGEKYRVPSMPFTLDGVAPPPGRAVPALGAHTDDIAGREP